jgi:hypothetical protein
MKFNRINSQQDDIIDFSNHKDFKRVDQYSNIIQDFNHGKNLYEIEYNDDTINKYRALRIQRLDPISHNKIEEDLCFKFPYIWDSLTGERLSTKDPYGGLCFDVITLSRLFYINRTKHLWVEEYDEGQDGYIWSGYPDEGLGKGETFHIKSRGYHPEWYLFRLPILDCYIPKDLPEQIPTFGPKLTYNEIVEINDKLQKGRLIYKNMYYNEPPDLLKLKEYYDKAIDPIPYVYNSDNMDVIKLREARDKVNYEAVHKLRTLKG